MAFEECTDKDAFLQSNLQAGLVLGFWCAPGMGSLSGGAQCTKCKKAVDALALEISKGSRMEPWANWASRSAGWWPCLWQGVVIQ